MDTDNDPNTHPVDAPHGAFPVDRPVEALLRDHNLVRQLAEHYRNSDSIEVKKQAAGQILQALHTHSRVEESVFYPGVRDVEPGMIGHFEQEHLKADDLLATLQGMALDDPRSEPMLRELIDMSLHHMQEEEEQFFPRLEAAQLDMSAIGLQMAALEANLIHMQAQGGGAPMQR
ncbi:MAG TPA: hemerythrin domain-containing protein [Telluria sp.]|jgi:hemerythrin superfamily protein